MASTIKLKNGSGAPLAGDLVQGEPALDLTNKRLYTENASGTVIEVGTNPTSVTTGNITSSGTVSVDTIAEKTAANGVVVDGVTLKDGGITVTADVAFGDNDKATFGASDDLQIYHDGSNSYIKEVGTGSLYIDAENFVLRNNGDNGKWINAYGDTITLLYNDSTKLATTATGIDVTGEVESDTAHFGTGTGSGISSADEVVVSGTGSTGLTIHSPDANNATLAFGSATDNDYAFVQGFYNSGSPFLRFSIQNSEKVKVTSTGIDVTGTVTADGYSFDYGNTLSLTSGATGTTLLSTSFVSGQGDFLNITPAGSSSSNNVLFRTANASVYADRLRVHSTGDISFYEDTGTTAKVFWDASAERFGINTASPAYTLDVAGVGNFATTSGDAQINITNSTTTGRSLIYFNDSSGLGGRLLYNHAADYMSFETAGANERMRIHSAGYLLLGKTSSDISQAGCELFPSDRAAFTRDSGYPLLLNRLTSDGDIINLRKDGTTVGSIGTGGGSLTVNSSGSTLVLSATDVAIQLSSTEFRPFTADDATVNLGGPAQRFKDLYLSGGVYLGGTGAANLLDDYEENIGAWSPVLEGTTSGTLSPATVERADYVKIGDLVHAACYVTFNLSSHSLVGNLRIGGLPFASRSFTGTAMATLCSLFTGDEADIPVGGLVSGDTILLTKGSGLGYYQNTDLSSATSTLFIISICYKAA